MVRHHRRKRPIHLLEGHRRPSTRPANPTLNSKPTNQRTPAHPPDSRILNSLTHQFGTSADTFLSVVTSSAPVGPSSRTFKSGPGTEPVSRIVSVDFVSLTSSTFDADGLAGPPSSVDLDELRPGELDHPCAGVRKILTAGTFYFSPSSSARSFDLTTRLEARLARERASAKGKGRGSPARERDGGDAEAEGGGLDVDERFLWNRYLVAPVLNFRSSLPGGMREVFDAAGFAILAIQGFVGSAEVNLAGQPASLSLISRLGWKRAGTRYNVRGIDDEGAVASE